eukprot:11199084-Lingulodinium_polyedra.AAC.1
MLFALVVVGHGWLLLSLVVGPLTCTPVARATTQRAARATTRELQCATRNAQRAAQRRTRDARNA